MLLLIDAGNTRIKWALVEQHAAPGDWHASGALAHAELATLAQLWQHTPPARAIIANVAGAAVKTHLQQVLKGVLAPDAISWFSSQSALAGLRNGYREPTQLGCDRFAAAIGARALAPGQAVIVATCGTATTIDAIQADGLFEGGMILPGLALMANSLARNTAQLPQIAPDAPLPREFADNTDDAIRSGCLAAQAGAIERAYAHHRASVCIVSGGAAGAIAPALGIAHRIVDNIVLIGLHVSAATFPG